MGPLVPGPGGCPRRYWDLNIEVAKAIDNDQNRSDTVYHGLLPQNIPMDQPRPGCSTIAARGPSQFQGTMAHELAHDLDLEHAPCDRPDATLVVWDQSYPLYEPYDPTQPWISGHLRAASLGGYYHFFLYIS